MSFGEIKGHQKQIKLIISSIKADLLHHAYLFSGPEGVGKTTVAVAMAKAIMCRNFGDDSCGSCASCRLVEERSHPDLWIIEPEKGIIKIDVIRDLASSIAFSAFEARRRVVIIREADKMNQYAANALLKTLEEPPERTVFILTTTSSASLLPTIVSRCQKIDFGPLPPQLAEEVIKKKGGVDDSSAKTLASISGGSPGKAMRYDEQLALFLRPHFVRTLMSCSTAEISRLFELSHKLDSLGDDLEVMLGFYEDWFRDILCYKLFSTDGRIMHVDMKDELADWARRLSFKEALKCCEFVSWTKAAIQKNANRLLAIDNMLIKIAGVLK